MTEDTAPEIIDQIADNTTAWLDKNHADGGVCDFCCHLLDQQTVVTYITDKQLVESMFVIGGGGTGDNGVLDYVNDEYWAACPDCDTVIQQGDPDALANHVYATADYGRIGVPRDRTDKPRLTSLYRRFFAANPKRDPDWRPDLNQKGST